MGDRDLSLVVDKIGDSPRAKAINFDVFNDFQRIEEIQKADIVISMLPASLHFKVAQNRLFWFRAQSFLKIFVKY